MKVGREHAGQLVAGQPFQEVWFTSVYLQLGIDAYRKCYRSIIFNIMLCDLDLPSVKFCSLILPICIGL